ncbi:MAG: hypothetical protein QGG14_04340 [Planctomycetota bacterium]|nr:hypothetical protein [Planctomycetota bacterium]
MRSPALAPASLILIAGRSVALGSRPLPQLGEPIEIEANGRPIATSRGQVAPSLVDHDGEGNGFLFLPR